MCILGIVYIYEMLNMKETMVQLNNKKIVYNNILWQVYDVDVGTSGIISAILMLKYKFLMKSQSKLAK